MNKVIFCLFVVNALISVSCAWLLFEPTNPLTDDLASETASALIKLRSDRLDEYYKGLRLMEEKLKSVDLPQTPAQRRKNLRFLMTVKKMLGYTARSQTDGHRVGWPLRRGLRANLQLYYQGKGGCEPPDAKSHELAMALPKVGTVHSSE